MALLSLILGAGVLPGTETGSNKKPDKTKSDKIMKRDGYSCRFCGFTSEKYQRVIRDPVSKDYVTGCTLCEQVLDPVRSTVSGISVLIWLPEIDQAQLNHTIRAIYVAREEGGAVADHANRALDALMARRADVKKRLGSDDPVLLATVFNELLAPQEIAKAFKKLDGVRLLPADKYIVRTATGNVDQFPKMIEYWTSTYGPYGQTTSDQWQAMFQKLAAA